MKTDSRLWPVLIEEGVKWVGGVGKERVKSIFVKQREDFIVIFGKIKEAN